MVLRIAYIGRTRANVFLKLLYMPPTDITEISSILYATLLIDISHDSEP